MSAAEGRGSGARGRAVQQAPGLWRTDLQRQDLSVPGREVVQSRLAIGPEAPLVRHTHAGEEIIYVLEGSPEHQIEGQPLMTFNGDALTSRPERSTRCGMLAAVIGRNPPAMSPEEGSRSSRSPSERQPRRYDRPLFAPPGRKGVESSRRRTA
jgi:hypothetical protein